MQQNLCKICRQYPSQRTKTGGSYVECNSCWEICREIYLKNAPNLLKYEKIEVIEDD